MGGISTPPLPPTPTMPAPDDAAAAAVQRQSIYHLMGMQGREATNLTAPNPYGNNYVSDALGAQNNPKQSNNPGSYNNNVLGK